MNPMTPEEIKELLRAVGCPGRSRDIVALKFVRGIGVQGSDVRVEFAPDTVKADKVQAMEDGIRRVLGEAGFTRVDIETEPPYDDDSMLLGGESVNPLQVDLGEYGLPQADAEGADTSGGAGAKPWTLDDLEQGRAGAVGAVEDDPLPEVSSDGPLGNLDAGYDGAIPVFQWQIDPQASDTTLTKVKLSIGAWNFVVWWLLHPEQNLLYASIQARHWVKYNGEAKPNPAGKTEAVNLVYDLSREGISAIYGTVRDFRPFAEAFQRAYTDEGLVHERIRVGDEEQAAQTA